MNDPQHRLADHSAEWPEECLIFPVAEIALKVVDGPHPYCVEEQAYITANWEAEIAANPALYDGRMMLSRAVRIRDGVISGTSHIIPFSAFMAWRKTRPPGLAVHLFGLPLMMSADGAVIAIRMGRHTANPGRVYCAAGSLDPADIRDGFCDLDANMAREVLEETGIDLSTAASVSGFYGFHQRGVITVFRTYRLSETAAMIIDRIRAHIGDDPEPEIDDALAIRSADPELHPYMPFMPPILAWLFAQPR